MQDFSTLDQAWLSLFDQFALRFDATGTEHGRETARMVRAHADARPQWHLCAHDVVLAGALAPLYQDPLAQALERLSPFLVWQTRGVFTDNEHTNRAYVEFMGPDGMLYSDQVRLGIYWHDRHTFYPRHRHEAVELYHIVSGTGFWQHVTDTWTPRPPNSYVLHQANEDHATKTGAEPLLALWSWLGDISFNSYSMDAAPTDSGMGFRDFPSNQSG